MLASYTPTTTVPPISFDSSALPPASPRSTSTSITSFESLADHTLASNNSECREMDILAQKTFDQFNLHFKGMFDIELYWKDRELEKKRYLEKMLGKLSLASQYRARGVSKAWSV
ncbi:hypothetical protein IAR50_007512 [Cryptococcus sp. DSM 104548]